MKSDTVSTFSPSICHEVMGLDAMILVFGMLSFKPFFFTLLFHPHQEALQFLFIFWYQSGIICISEVIDHQMVNTEIRLIIFFVAKVEEALCQKSAKTRPRVVYGSDHELLIAKFRLKLKKVGKTTRPFRYNLNHIPYDYTVTNRLTIDYSLQR